MPPVQDLASRRLALLRRTLEAALRRDGATAQAVSDLGPITVEQWWQAAHHAENTLDRPIATGLARQGTVAWAAIADWPRTPDELLRAGQALAHARTTQTHRDQHDPHRVG